MASAMNLHKQLSKYGNKMGGATTGNLVASTSLADQTTAKNSTSNLG